MKCLSVSLSFSFSICFRNFKKIRKSWENEAPIQANVSKHSCLKWIKKKLGGRKEGRKLRKRKKNTQRRASEARQRSKSTSSRAQPRNYTTEKGLISRIIIHLRFYPLG
jgi:hypothetical protein